ncbi:MAG: glutathione S-transferase family protein [Polyangiales bacterium]
MITLYGFRGAFGLPDLSPFVTKAETYFHLAKIPFEKKPGDRNKAPRGKFPYIDDGGVIVADSTAIIEHCKARYGDALDAGITPREVATGTACKSMLEEHLYFLTLYLRWQDPRGWAVMEPEVRALAASLGVPGFLRGAVANMIRKDVLKKNHAQGTGRYDVAFVEASGVRIVDALAYELGDRPWFLGDAPRSFDATVFAFTLGTLRFPVDNAVSARARGHQNLVDYCDRIEKAHFPRG